MGNISEKECIKNQTTKLCSITFFGNLLDNEEKYDKARQATDGNVGEYGASALHAGHLRLQTHPQNINTYCLSTATIVTFIRTWPSLFTVTTQ